jgi:hypothetical protein
MLINGDGEQFPYTALTTPGAFVAGTSNATDELQQLVARGPVVEGSAVGVTRSGEIRRRSETLAVCDCQQSVEIPRGSRSSCKVLVDFR